MTRKGFVTGCVGLYLLAVIGIGLLLWFTADNWWVSTIFLFGPRWVVALPLVPLVPLALVGRSWRLVLSLVVAALIVAAPIMGGTISPIAWASRKDNGETLRVMTCNTDGPSLHSDALKVLIAQTAPDIVALQEYPTPDANNVFPKDWLPCEGPSGLRLGSRFPVKKFDYIGEQELGMQGVVGRYVLETPWGIMPFAIVHLPTPRDGFELLAHGQKAGIGVLRGQIVLRERASAIARDWIGNTGPLLIIAGDFNMPQESAIFQRHWSGLNDAFAAAGWGWGLTKQTHWFDVRIDHILAGSKWRCRSCWVGPDVGSDHLPVIAEFQ